MLLWRYLLRILRTVAERVCRGEYDTHKCVRVVSVFPNIDIEERSGIPTTDRDEKKTDTNRCEGKLLNHHM